MADAYTAARRSNRRADESLNEVRRQKSIAGTRDPNRDTSAENAALARRSKNWLRDSTPDYTGRR
jgi:hypothetical protein